MMPHVLLYSHIANTRKYSDCVHQFILYSHPNYLGNTHVCHVKHCQWQWKSNGSQREDQNSTTNVSLCTKVNIQWGSQQRSQILYGSIMHNTEQFSSARIQKPIYNMGLTMFISFHSPHSWSWWRHRVVSRKLVSNPSLQSKLMSSWIFMLAM